MAKQHSPLPREGVHGVRAYPLNLVYSLDESAAPFRWSTISDMRCESSCLVRTNNIGGHTSE